MKKLNCVGVDIFICQEKVPALSHPQMATTSWSGFKLKAISNRGTCVWPNRMVGFSLSDVYRCRFVGNENEGISQKQILEILKSLDEWGLNWVHLEKLHSDGEKKLFSEMH